MKEFQIFLSLHYFTDWSCEAFCIDVCFWSSGSLEMEENKMVEIFV